MLKALLVNALFLCAMLLPLVACSPAPRAAQTYTNSSGSMIYLENNTESCGRSCNGEYDRCGESQAASEPVGRGQMSGIFGGEADCRSTLRNCLKTCRGR